MHALVAGVERRYLAIEQRGAQIGEVLIRLGDLGDLGGLICLRAAGLRVERPAAREGRHVVLQQIARCEEVVAGLVVYRSPHARRFAEVPPCTNHITSARTHA